MTADHLVDDGGPSYVWQVTVLGIVGEHPEDGL